jgi:hypothetical protein
VCFLSQSYDKDNKRYQDLYYWQGKDSSQDEKGAVSLWSIELDKMLNGKPVQHREVQDYESSGFLSLWPKGSLSI